MPVTVIVGGQFGSEGKGKVSLHETVAKRARVVVRVGGTNSGHTAVDNHGKIHSLRQLPAAVLAPETIAVLPPGALVDPDIFEREVRSLGLSPDRVAVSPLSTVVTQSDIDTEGASGIISSIGSTGSGTGAALARRISRKGDTVLAAQCDKLRPFLRDTTSLMRSALEGNSWIVVEGTQGFGLSVLHGGHYPYATSRDTTAAAFVSEAGLSPIDVKEIVLVLRAHPIRVAGTSGPLRGETTWAQLAQQAGLPSNYKELTTATKKVRRIGVFDSEIVNRAISLNSPSKIVLNHFDYVDPAIRQNRFTTRALNFLLDIEERIGRPIDLVGTGPASLLKRSEIGLGQRQVISR